jgi:phospholipid methyltransferase
MLCWVRRMPRPAGVLVWMAGAVAMHAVVPFELSRLDDRARRPARRFPAMRGAGLVTVAAGAGLMAWALAAHYQAAPRGWALESGLTPQYLLRRGPYRLSRNPMYAGEAVVWLGWALFYRRPAVWGGWPSSAPPSRDRAVGRAAAPEPLRRRRLPGLPGGGSSLGAAPAERREGTRCRRIDRPRLIRVEARVVEIGMQFLTVDLRHAMPAQARHRAPHLPLAARWATVRAC